MKKTYFLMISLTGLLSILISGCCQSISPSGKKEIKQVNTVSETGQYKTAHQ